MENLKQKTEEGIDEEYLMSIMAGGTQKGGLQNSEELPEKDKETVKAKQSDRGKGKNKKRERGTYGEQFLTCHTMPKRGDKTIYIRAEYHDRLSRIVQIIGEDQIPLYAYLDNILQHHFEMFEKDITEDFNNKYRPIF